MTVILTVDDGTGTNTISDVIGFSVRAGRQSKTETYSASSATVTVRNLSSIPSVYKLGWTMRLVQNNYPDWINLFSGTITNISYNYGTIPAMDTATFTVEGYLGFMGRGQLNNFTLAGGTTGAEAYRIGTSLTGNPKGGISNAGTASYTNSTTNYTGAAMNIIQTLVAMEQGRLEDTYGNLYFWGRHYLKDPDIYGYAFFTDDPASTGSTAIHYDQIEFGSLADNYFTQVQITPDGITTQIAGTGDRNLTLSTYDKDATQAANLASYCLGEFDNNGSVPVAISTTTALMPLGTYLASAGVPIAAAVPITFRGTVYNSIIEGYTVTGTPEMVRYTFMLSGFEQNNYLRLDDTVYGRLDYNQLSF